MSNLIRTVLVLAAASMLVTGGWARFDPAGFATWAGWPNHVHFLHDAGVFQMGIGLMLVAALWWRDVVTLVLGGFVVTNTLHAYNHAADLDLGGRTSDPWLLLVFSMVAAAGLMARRRALAGRVRRTGEEVSA
ncbi:hypothetical protein [Nonomuraea sp. NPDC005501]|uniref:hypothetical protein n=1 Tax=Nonomuraea sp. NPDC005501 TaxID=3156884 RepID=UPI0033B390C4